MLDLSTGEHRVVIRGGHDAHYLPTGHLVYGVNDTLRAVAFDLDRLEVVGTPVRVLGGVHTTTQGAINAAVATNGTLVYLPRQRAAGAAARSLVWVARDGREEAVPAPPRAFESLQLSPDGSRAVIQIEDQERDIWVWTFAPQTLTRLTFSPQTDYDPAWMPDGRRIVFSRQGLLISRAADGTGAEKQLTKTGNVLPTSFTPDGKRLVVTVGAGQTDIGLLSIGGPSGINPLVQTRFNDGRAYLSPDGRWLAYQSNESGQDQVYVQPFPDLGAGRWQVSPAGGSEPAWARKGGELFYLDGAGALVTVRVQTQPTFSAGNPSKLFDAPYYSVTGTRRYDVTADGQRFLFIRNAPDESQESAPTRLVLVQNWFEELKRLVPTN